MTRFMKILLLTSLFGYYLFCQGTVTQNPLTACEGDTITFSCVLTPPDGGMFRSTTPRFIVGNSSATLLDTEINMNISHPDVDLSRISAPVFLGGTLTRVSGDLILHSYLPTDAGLRLGCSAQYVDNGTTTVMMVEDTLRLNQTAPPSAPISLQSSVSNFNTATCSADISLSWNTPPSNRTVDKYFLYLDGSPLATTNSNSYIHSTILNINTDYQYSVTAMSCAGNSTTSSTNISSFASYSLMRSSQYVCLAYDNVTGELTVNWGLSTHTQPSGVSGLDITYSLQLLYSHSRQGVTYTYTDSTSFTLPSSQLRYNATITAHNFTQLDGVETNITANLMIVQQCGQSFNGTAMECLFNSNNPTTTPANSSTATTTSISRNTTFSTLTPTTANTTNTTLSITIIIIGSTVGGVSFVVILSTPTFLFVLLVIFLSKKKKNEEHTGTDGSGVKNYKELGEDTYSEVNKKPKHKPEPVKKDQCELNYLEIDHSSGTGKIVKPPIIPKTNYADINSFPQETQYASLQN